MTKKVIDIDTEDIFFCIRCGKEYNSIQEANKCHNDEGVTAKKCKNCGHIIWSELD